MLLYLCLYFLEASSLFVASCSFFTFKMKNTSKQKKIVYALQSFINCISLVLKKMDARRSGFKLVSQYRKAMTKF